MDYNSFLELVQKRRTIRSFKPDPVPDELIDKIIEAVRWAPSGANSQPWEFIVVKKQELKDGIVKIFEEGDVLAYRMELTREPQLRLPLYNKPPQQPPSFATAPVFIVMCGDPRTKIAYPIRDGSYRGQSNYLSSLASACIYLHLAATTLGLGAKWITATGIPFEQCLIKQLLEIPNELEIYETIAIGYPAHEPKPRMLRAKEDIVHCDYYDKTKFRTDNDVKSFISSLRNG
ncbi:nitroreductase family protein [Chloroflexota bacterium]